MTEDAFAAVTVPWVSNGATLFDNGPTLEANLDLRFNVDDDSVYDDFVLQEDSIITGFEWSQFEAEVVGYSSTELTIWNGTPTITDEGDSMMFSEFLRSARPVIATVSDAASRSLVGSVSVRL